MEDSWKDDAFCKGVGPTAFYSHNEGDLGHNIAESRLAVMSTKDRFCSKCQVSIECLEYALKRNERDGIWGGMTERERQSLRRARSRARRSVNE